MKMNQELPETRGYADVLIGLQYGDEGKARVVDFIAPQYDIIARFNGGSNAGHTIETPLGNLALQQIPSAVFYPDKLLYVGSGCVINPSKVIKEIENVRKLGINLAGRLHFSCQAGIVQPHHVLIDGLIGKAIGTTKNGIGPAYADRATRMVGERLVSIRLGDLFDDTEIQLRNIRANYLATLADYGLENSSDAENTDLVMTEFATAFEELRPYIQNDPLFLERKVQNGARVLFEGAQSVMLDVNKGSVPFVTSSLTTAAAAYTGGDLSPEYHRKTIGITKALMSRVGFGPFPPEFGGRRSEEYCMAKNEQGETLNSREKEATFDIDELLMSVHDFEIGKALRILSREYGTVTGRPRRVGILDLVQLANAARQNGVKELVINKCDLLREFARTSTAEIPLVTAYDLDGVKIDYLPASAGAGYRVRPIIEWFECFTEDVSGLRRKELLPKALLRYLARVEEITGCKIIGIGVGPNREQFINF